MLPVFLEAYMEYEVHPEKGMINRGNWARLKEVMRRAEAGDRITVGFIGGSITQGAVASYHSNCYAHLVFEWFEKTFPKSAFTYVNAGIGGTSSQFGVARADRDLLVYVPDIVFIEFSVNDSNDDFHAETYEGLVRRIYGANVKPAVILLHNIMYNTGDTAEEKHSMIGKHYNLPCISMRPTLYEEIRKKNINAREVTPDDLHPNTVGHALVASVINDFLYKVYENRYEDEDGLSDSGFVGGVPIQGVKGEKADSPADEIKLPSPVTGNRYENSRRIQNGIFFSNSADDSFESHGFIPDEHFQRHLYEFARNGWSAANKGESIRFTAKASCLAVQFIRTVTQPAPICEAVIDGVSENAIVLDANFDETWGDCLYLKNLLVSDEVKEHTVEIKVTETHENDASRFYLVSLIASFGDK